MQQPLTGDVNLQFLGSPIGHRVLQLQDVFRMSQLCFASPESVLPVSILFCKSRKCFACLNCVLQVPKVFCLSQLCFASPEF
jgi:hypothetical protein